MNIIQRTFNGIKRYFDGSVSTNFSVDDPFAKYRKKYSNVDLIQGTVYACIDVRALNVSKAKPVIYKESYQTDNPELNKTHDFVKLLYNPNQFMTRAELMWRTLGNLDLHGNCFWYLPQVAGKPKEIWILPANQIKYKFNNNNFPIGFVQTTSSKKGKKEIFYKLSEVLHIKYPNYITNPLYGLSVIERNKLVLSLNLSQLQYQERIIQNGGMPKTVFKSKKRYNDKQIDEFIQKWHERYSGVYNSDKIPFLQDDIDLVPISLNPKEIDYLISRQATKEDILEIFRVPEILLGNSKTVNKSTSQSQLIGFYETVISALLTYIDESLTKFLKTNYNNAEDLYIQHILPRPNDPEQRLKEFDLGLSHGAITKNEYRNYLGFGNKEDGDEIGNNSKVD